MNHFLFIGVSPSSSLKTLFEKNAVSVSVVPNPEDGLNTKNPTLVVLQTDTVESLSHLDYLRDLYPKSWIVPLVPRTALSNPHFYQAILDTKSKNDVWLQDDWEERIWLSVQLMLRHPVQTSTEAVLKHSQSLVKSFEKHLSLLEGIQRFFSIKPDVEPKTFSAHSKYIPGNGSGGDYFDIFELGDKRRVGVILADASSHAALAELLGLLVKIQVSDVKEVFSTTSTLLQTLNASLLKNDNKSALAFFFGILDRGTLEFHFSTAGHLSPTLQRRGRIQQVLVSEEPNLGTSTNHSYEDHLLILRPGDHLLLHTDGMNQLLKKGMSFQELLTENNESLSPEKLNNEMIGLADEAKEKRQLKEDVTLLQFTVDDKALHLIKVNSWNSK